MCFLKNYLISAAASSPTIHGLVRLVRSYSLRREGIENQSYFFRRNDQGPDGGAVDLKLILELSLNALVRLILHLQAENPISYTDLALIRVIVPELVDCAISEIFSMLRSRCTSYHRNIFCNFVCYKYILDFGHETLCCYDIYAHLNHLDRVCGGSGIQIQFLHSASRVSSCLELVRERGINCSVHATIRDLAQNGRPLTYLIYSFQFHYNFIEGALPASIRSLARPNPEYEIYWAHEVCFALIFISYHNIFSAIFICTCRL